MKWILFLILFCACSNDHMKVMNAYKKNNEQAKDLLLHGFNSKVAAYIDTILIDRALAGDEEAKLMVIAQMEAFRGMPEESRTMVMPVPIIRNHSSCRGGGGHR